MSSPVAKKAAKAPARQRRRARAPDAPPVHPLADSEAAFQILGTLAAAGEDDLLSAFRALVDALAHVQPSDPLQAMMVGQMVANHRTAMQCFARAASDVSAVRDSELRNAARCTQNYLQQYSAIEKGRRAERAHTSHSKMSLEEARTIIKSIGAKYLGDTLDSPTSDDPECRL